MKNTIAKTTIDFNFKCPHCERCWALGTGVKYDEPEKTNFLELMYDGFTVIDNCKCGNSFTVDVDTDESWGE